MVHRLLVLAAVVSAAVGCASGKPTQTSGASSDATAWELRGSRIIGCCCQTPCSCRANKKPFHCHGCDFTNVVHVDQGQLGGVKMDGATWVVVGRGFGEDKSKNWVYVYVAESMTEAQAKALQSFLEDGMKSWPPAKAAHLAGTFTGMRKVPMTYTVSADKLAWSCSIPGILEIDTRAIFNPGHKEPVRLSGIMDDFSDAFIQADCLKHTFKDSQVGAHNWDLTGRQANWTEFRIGSAFPTKSKLGWGCWSAHKEFGDASQYPEQYGGQDPQHK